MARELIRLRDGSIVAVEQIVEAPRRHPPAVIYGDDWPNDPSYPAYAQQIAPVEYQVPMTSRPRRRERQRRRTHGHPLRNVFALFVVGFLSIYFHPLICLGLWGYAVIYLVQKYLENE